MEWQTDAYELYQKFLSKIPDSFSSMAGPIIAEAAEKKSIERNDFKINISDLVAGLLEAIPKPFEANAISELENLGIDMRRYAKVKEIRQQRMNTWDDIAQAFHPGNYHFTMYLTDHCNQNCLHCAASLPKKRSELSTHEWIDIIENLEASLKERKRRGVYIWFGGEPTLRYDIRDLIKYCGHNGYFQAIATNGILFDDDFADYCMENHVSHVFISLDSIIAKKADQIRGAAGAYENAEKAIKIAVRHGLFVLVTATVMQQNLDELEQLKKTIENWGAMPYFRAVIKQRNAADNWEQVGLDAEGYKKFYEFKYQLTLDAIRKGNVGALPIFSTYDMVPFMEVPQNDEEMAALEWGVGCQACRTISGVDINGDLFPCDYPSKLTLGNLRETSFSDIMASQLFKDIRDKKRIGKCSDCRHLNLCGGGCRVHAESETGNFFESFSYCWAK